MRCRDCSSGSPKGAKFCLFCGARLALACPQCSTELPPEARFCCACGHRLEAPPAPANGATAEAATHRLLRLVPRQFAERLLATRGQVARERRTVTCLFSDVRGSTALAENLDPEDVMEIMDGAFDVLIEPIYHYEGTLARLMGDAVLAFFGAPIAHEDDPERACRAALQIIEGAKDYARRLARERSIIGFSVRVGINTGLVVVGEVGSDLRVEYTAIGDAINLAARMEQNAPPGGILITHDTYRHVKGIFDVLVQEPLAVKGKHGPVQTYLVQKAKPRAFRRGLRGVEGIETRTVGRDAELKYLQDAFRTVIDDRELQMVTLSGEAGVGKSRLLYEFDTWSELLPEQFYYFEARAFPEMQNRPYGLIRDLVAFRFHIQDSDTVADVRRKLEGEIGVALGHDENCKKAAHFVGHLVGFEVGDSPHLAGARDNPQRLRDQALAHLTDYFQGMARQLPVLILLEDLHWADDSSLDALNHLALALGEQPLMVVGTARHNLFERRQHWGEGQSFHRRLVLESLSKWDSRKLVAEILQKVTKVPQALRDLIVTGAEGNPFFIEELIKMLVEDGVIVKGEEQWQVAPSRLVDVRVPPTLTGVLQSRLDRLPLEEWMVLQQASVVGRLFWDRAVAHINTSAEEGIEEAELVDCLLALRDREMVFQRETSAFVDAQEYIFKHALLREITYGSVLRRSRQAYHSLVADWLLEQGGERVEEYIGLIADHMSLAGRVSEAIEYLLQAGDQARGLYAHEEAINAYERALALLEAAPPEQSHEGWQLVTTARLHECLGDVLELTGRHVEAQASYASALIRIPEGNLIWQARIHRKIGDTWRSQRRFEEACRAYDLAETAMGQEPDDAILDWQQEWIQIQLERMELHYWQGQQWREIAGLAEKTRSVVERCGTPIQRASFFTGLARMHLCQDRYVPATETLACAEAALTASQESGDPVWLADTQFTLGFIQLWRGNLDEAEEKLEASLGLAERTGYLTAQTQCLTYLAVISRKRRRVQETRRCSSQSLEVATAGQMPVYVAMARANLAWVAWLGGSLSEAKENAQAALELWPPVYPFQWAALWPLIGVALTRDQVSEAVGYGRALLEPLQQRLPDALTRELEKAIRIWEGGEPEDTAAILDGAIELAQEMGYL